MTLRINTTYNTSMLVSNVKDVYVLGNLLVVKQVDNRRTFLNYNSIKSVRKISKK